MFEPKKRCTKCRELKYEGEFQWQRNRLSSWCDSCRCFKTPEQQRGYNQRWARDNKHKHLIRECRARAEKKQLPFDLDLHEDAIRTRVYAARCELSGLPLELVARGRAEWNSASIDRVKPELGYVYSNIRIICNSLNTAIGHWGEEQTAVLMQAWLDQRKAA